MSTSENSGWATTRGYMWSMLGTAIGFANLLAFGSHSYKYGGAAFLIPFLTALFLVGVPILILEGIVGQSTQKPLVAAYHQLAGRRFKFFGWLGVLAVATIGSFYIVLTGWAVAYAYFSAMGVIPEDTAHFFVHDFLGATGDVTAWGAISWPAMIATVVVALFCWRVLSKNIQDGIERWCSLFLPLLGVMIAIFAVAVIMLPGSSEGFVRYLRPDFSKILDFNVWRAVCGQLFFSMSLGIGIVVGYSRHTQQHTSIPRAMMQVALADFLVSFIAGFVIFGCVGYMSHQSGTPFDDIVAGASTFQIGYVIFPKILATFGPILAAVLGVVFFFCVFIAGITGQFSIVESIAGNLQVEFGRTRKQAVAIALFAVTALAVLFCFGNGTAVMDALEPAVLGDNMLIGGIAQTIALFWMAKSIRENAAWYRHDGRKLFAYYALRIVPIPVLGVILFASWKQAIVDPFGADDVVRWAWMGGAIVLAAVLARNGKK